MKTLEVSDEQYAFIQHLREVLSDQVVGPYGHVRDRDAVQFLIDNYDDPSGIDLDVETESTDADAEISFDEDDAPGDADDDDTAGEADGDDAAGDADDDDAPGDDAGADDETEADAADDDDGDGSASDDDMLDRMMKLLDTHDDKWEESPSADYRYRVELPDGATEDVQTKDDVRALLFKHY